MTESTIFFPFSLPDGGLAVEIDRRKNSFVVEVTERDGQIFFELLWPEKPENISQTQRMIARLSFWLTNFHLKQANGLQPKKNG